MAYSNEESCWSSKHMHIAALCFDYSVKPLKAKSNYDNWTWDFMLMFCIHLPLYLPLAEWRSFEYHLSSDHLIYVHIHQTIKNPKSSRHHLHISCSLKLNCSLFNYEFTIVILCLCFVYILVAILRLLFLTRMTNNVQMNRKTKRWRQWRKQQI